MNTKFRSATSFGGKSTKVRKTTATAGKVTARGYKNLCNTFNQKIASYKTLCGQATGMAKGTRPTAATLNTFAKWIEKGAVVHKVSPAQVRKWANTTQTFKTPTSAKNALCRCFGKTTIKAVTTEKSGAFLVACSPVVKGKPFNFPR